MNASWLKHYDPGVPATIGTYPDRTLVDVVREQARSRPDATAVLFKGRRMSYRELDVASDALARALRMRGLERGERIAIVLPNCPQFLIAELAAWKLGAIIAPQNPIYTEREMQESLVISEPKFAIVLTPFYSRIKSCQRATSVRTVIATNIKEYLPGVLGVLFTLLKEKKEGHRIRLEQGDLWLQDLVREGGGGAPVPSVARPGDDAVILMSGGTTGSPKGVVSEHRSLVMSGSQLGAWLREAITPGSSLMLPLPLFHTYGCTGAQSLAFLEGIPLSLIPNPRDLTDIVKAIPRDRPALFCGVPTLFNALLSHPMVVSGKADFRSINACFSGAAALMAETKKRFEDLTGGRIVEGYSLTEATMACCVNPLRGVNKIGSIGMPLPDVQVRIVDSEWGIDDLPAGQVGEIIIRAPQLMRGYWNRPDETALVLRDGWLYTGDLGYLDDDGYIFIVDRKKDLIKTSGFQVWPREIEEVLSSHPTVAEVGVAGVPDEKKGEKIIAWVVPRGDTAIDVEALREWCRLSLAPYKVPARIEIRSELPKTMIGKVLRRVLVAEERAKSAAQ